MFLKVQKCFPQHPEFYSRIKFYHKINQKNIFWFVQCSFDNTTLACINCKCLKTFYSKFENKKDFFYTTQTTQNVLPDTYSAVLTAKVTFSRKVYQTFESFTANFENRSDGKKTCLEKKHPEKFLTMQFSQSPRNLSEKVWNLPQQTRTPRLQIRNPVDIFFVKNWWSSRSFFKKKNLKFSQIRPFFAQYPEWTFLKQSILPHCFLGDVECSF